MLSKIKLDKDTQQILREYQRTVNECQTRIQLICQIILNVSGQSGDYQLSPTGTELIKVKKPKNEKT